LSDNLGIWLSYGIGNPGKLVIINLQKTPIDKSADIRIFARVDEVMSAMASSLHLTIPNYVRRDAVVVGHRQQRPRPKKKPGAQQHRNGKQAAAVGSAAPFEIFVESIHGPKCPLLMVETVKITVQVGLARHLSSCRNLHKPPCILAIIFELLRVTHSAFLVAAGSSLVYL
jgi:hypothetical protein